MALHKFREPSEFEIKRAREFLLEIRTADRGYLGDAFSVMSETDIHAFSRALQGKDDAEVGRLYRAAFLRGARVDDDDAMDEAKRSIGA